MRAKMQRDAQEDSKPRAHVRRHETVVQQIEDDILSQRLGVGMSLPSERVLSERFKVGRATVREALLTLRRRGLIEGANGVPARVVSPKVDGLVREISVHARRYSETPEGVRHLQHARALLEIGLAREAALYANDEDKQAIARALALNEEAIGNQERFTKADIAFHFAIAKASHNPIFVTLHESMFDWLADQRQVSSRAARLAEDVVVEHRRILEAILKRDGAAAADAMEFHLAAVVRAYWAAMTPAFARVDRSKVK
jgi:DNA-binding FadR family transcriptional regulator